MNDHYQKNTSLREENIELAKKLKGLVEQYELREQVRQIYIFKHKLNCRHALSPVPGASSRCPSNENEDNRLFVVHLLPFNFLNSTHFCRARQRDIY